MTTRLLIRCVGLIALVASFTAAQDPGSVRKRLVTYSGILKYDAGTPRVGVVGLTLSLYAEQEGGEPLWRESQTVQTDEQGRYTVLLGATEEEGLPLEFFTSGMAQWLGLQVQGGQEQARILLVTVPYALKAADADTVGGRPLSSFVLYEDLEKAVGKSLPTPAIFVQNGVAPGRSGLSGTGNTAGSIGGQGAEKLLLSGGNTPVASNEIGSNTWFGEGAGASITTSTGNSFFGMNAGNQTSGATGYLSGSYNSFFGRDAGRSNTIGGWNAFYGADAGYYNVTGSHNSFFGTSAGYSNTTGHQNSFFGETAGASNTDGYSNSFFGSAAGRYNTSGAYNTFMGGGAGDQNTSGSSNAFFGEGAGGWNATGWYNTFIGSRAGVRHSTGNYNTFVGESAGEYETTSVGNTLVGFQAGQGLSGDHNTFIGYHSGGSGNNVTALGSHASADQSNSLVLGGISGINGATEDTNVGIGTTAPSGRLHVMNHGDHLLYVDPIGDIGIGTASPDKRVHIVSTEAKNATLHLGGAGDAWKDIFAGMGEDVDAGPAFNYGYAGYSFGRSAGFFNVRPDPSAVAPNPSLRFMTANQQRMIITNTGDVGIGTTDPKVTLHVQGTGVYVGSPGEGIILKSPDGLKCAKLTIDNSGTPGFAVIACP